MKQRTELKTEDYYSYWSYLYDPHYKSIQIPEQLEFIFPFNPLKYWSSYYSPPYRLELQQRKTNKQQKKSQQSKQNKKNSTSPTNFCAYVWLYF